ncbi:hypothetical protein [Stenotrophomonas muris]|uniref:hypothetical protein n=1 Tax=Stenotrophomonas muris TaxID=2963283 RepID=UPI002E7A37B6|nr:hypothetical protein [Stenotrophomonas muris]
MKSWNSLFLLSILLLAGCREPNAPLPASTLPAGSGSDDAQSAAEVEPPVAQDQAGPSVMEGIDVAKASDQSYCNIESVGSNAFVAGPLAVAPAQKVHGWLGHSTPAPVGSPMLVLLGEHGAAAGIALQLSMVRDDVVNAYGGRAELRESGFEAALPDVPAGTYKLLLHYIVDGKTYRCDNGRQVTFNQ